MFAPLTLVGHSADSQRFAPGRDTMDGTPSHAWQLSDKRTS